MNRDNLARNKTTKRHTEDDEDNNSDDSSVEYKSKAKKRKTDKFSSRDSENESESEDEFDTNVPLEAGQIVKVHVENFMCHRKFTVEFNRHLNFVNGQNGSGKSAIAVALQLCLGATAKTTGRGSNMSGLIREGSDGPALIRVTLRNEGADAYLPNEYGKRIHIERRITKSGNGGGYQLLSEHMEVKSHEKKVLEQMLRTFNIYVDNPCCVLTQEESKKFIQGQETDKYDFFLKATGLKRTKDELFEAAKAIEAITADIDGHKGRVATKKGTCKSLKLTLDSLLELDKIDGKIKMCRAKAYWADHRYQKTIRDNMQIKVDEKQAELDATQREVEEAEAKANSDTNEMDALSAQLDILHREYQEAQALESEKQKAALDMTREVNMHKSDLAALMKSRHDLNVRIKEVSKELNDKREKALRDADKDEREILEKIQLCNEEVDRRLSEEAKMRKEKQECEEAAADILRQNQQLSAQVNAINREIGKLSDEQREMSGNTMNNASRFGKAADILRQIERTRFRGPVFGPVGMLIQMRDGYQDWGLALERSLGATIRSFVVTNHEDRQTLGGIIKNLKAGGAHSIIMQTPHARYNVVSLLEHGITTTADAVVVTEDLVFNALVDQCNLDRTALVETEEECRRKLVVRDRDGLDTLTRFLSAAITKSGTQVKYNRGNQSSEVFRGKYSHLLAKDPTEYLQQIAQQIVEKRHESADIANRQRDLKLQQDQAVAASRRLDRPVADNANELRRLNTSKRVLDTQLSEAQAAKHIDTSELEHDLIDLNTDLDNVARQIVDKEALLALSVKEQKVRNDEKRECEKQSQGVQDQMSVTQRQLEKEINARKDSRNKVESLKKVLNSRRTILERDEGALQRERDTEQELYKVAQENSSDLVPDYDGLPLPLTAKDSRVTMEREEKTLRLQLAEGRRTMGVEGHTLEVITDRYARALQDYNALKENVRQLESNLQGLDDDYDVRSKRWNASLLASADRVKKKFDEYIQIKGQSGTIVFHHKNHTLSLIVQIDNMDANTKSNEVRNLSGGERSFVTFSLLLALGHVIECPFRLMDEYDVFLDEMSRRITLDQLQSYALMKEQRSRQFIIITPHKLNDVKITPQVKIIRMLDPQRREAHGLQQQTINF